jgi:hypothetical protein
MIKLLRDIGNMKTISMYKKLTGHDSISLVATIVWQAIALLEVPN